jgi:hypothetical protein
MEYFTTLFLRIEERARVYFEQFPFLHAFLAALGIIFLWHGLWDIVDILDINIFWTITIGFLIMSCTGLFIQTFVGSTIIIKKFEGEKQKKEDIAVDLSVIQKEVSTGEDTVEHLVKTMAKRLEEIDAKLNDLNKK